MTRAIDRNAPAAPALSVLMPVWNGAETLAIALACVARQSFTDYELVAVDDGSTDRTLALLEAAARRDPRIRVVPQPRGGLVAALNGGLAACRAPLVVRMDADDVCHWRRFETQKRFLDTHPDIDVVGCHVRHFRRPHEGTIPEGTRRYEDWMNALMDPESIRQGFFLQSSLAHASAMIRREVLLDAEGYRDGDFGEDHDLWLRLDEAGRRFAKVPHLFYLIRDRLDRYTRVEHRLRQAAVRSLVVHHIARRIASTPDRPIVLWGAGRSVDEIAGFFGDEGRDCETVRFKPPRGVAPKGAWPATEEGALMVLCYGSARPREAARRELEARGLVEIHDFICMG